MRRVPYDCLTSASSGWAERNRPTGSVTTVWPPARHLEFHDGRAVFDYPARSGVRGTLGVLDPENVALLRRLCARSSWPDEFLAFRKGGRWHRLGGDGVND